MALPWLIAGLAAVATTALVKKLNENNNDNGGGGGDYEREARRREEAERERAENDREKKRETACENFSSRGESIGGDISHSLKGWIDVNFENTPAFSAKLTSNDYNPIPSFLTSNDYCVEHAIENEKFISKLFPNGNQEFDIIRKNLKIYSDNYSVRLKIGTKLVEAVREIDMIESELQQISKLKADIYRLQSDFTAQL